jgi:dihydrofolate synthase/folylpolyglutamate synthase
MDTSLSEIFGLSDYASVRDYLYKLRYHGAKYGLERMVSIAGALGNPERTFPSIHVAGTNGKGSTSAMLERILRESGKRTGLFTSPHLIHQGERIQVDREPLSEDAIVRLTRSIARTMIEKHGDDVEKYPSFFEFITAMSFVHFQQEGVDIAVYETGLGGRLDATNILMPEVSVITSISLDHTTILGDTIEAIAAEKAGIIKQEVPVVIGRLPEAAEAVIRERACAQRAPLYSVRERYGEAIERYPLTNLHGQFQRINAATASLTIEVLKDRGYHLDEGCTARALADVDWPGRWEAIHVNGGQGTVILDATHNEEGAKMLDMELEKLVISSATKPIVVVGSLGEERAKSLMAVVARHASKIYLVTPNQPRALSTEALRKAMPQGCEVEVWDASVESLFSYRSCSLNTPGSPTVLVTGSIYLIGEVSDRLKSETLKNQQSLQDVI